MIDEKLTPTHRSVGVHLDKVYEEIGDSFDNGRDLTLDQIKTMIRTSLLTSRQDTDELSSSLDKGFQILKTVSEKDEETSTAIYYATLSIALAVLGNTTNIANSAIEREMSTFGGLAQQNAAKSEAMLRAAAVADELWKSDEKREIRIGTMAEKVYRQLVSEGYEKALPETVERLKDWIKNVAPAYSRKGGKPKKTR